MFSQFSFPSSVRLDSAGLVALADLKPITHRTGLMGTAYYPDVLVLAPGIHMQQDASEENGGELPVCAQMTSGYVFRVENPATVKFLQGIGRTGCLTTVHVRVSDLSVEANHDGGESGGQPKNVYVEISQNNGTEVKENDRSEPKKAPFTCQLRTVLEESGELATAFYLTACALTIVVIVLLGVIRDWWGIGIIFMLILARLINVIVVRRRAQLGWKGALEPGKRGDLLILLSQDRWIRMTGLVDDQKAVTAGQFLRDMTVVESSLASFATLLVYCSAALAGNASTTGSLMIALLLLVSVGLLGLCNNCTRGLRMNGRFVTQEGEPKRYGRRLEMAEELIGECEGRDDWAIAMGLVKSKPGQRVQFDEVFGS